MNIIKKELLYGAKNYLSTDAVCIIKGSGIYLTDIFNRRYMDFISAYSAVNQGHCHPRLVKKMHYQSKKLTLTSRALYNDKLGEYMENICNTFNFDKVLPMNTGVEGGETAIKIARKWGYEVKNVDSAVNLFCDNNFWGRTLAAVSSSTDPSCYTNFGPYMQGFKSIPYNCLDSLQKSFEDDPNIVSFMLEPIQGEAGIILPDIGYLKEVRKLCTEYNVLMIADEVQTGMGRTGKMVACDHEEIKPDILILGKALSGGMLPISAVLANNSIMDVITPGTHGSTFGGNPLASVIGIEAINIIKDENLCQNSYEMGKYFRDNLNAYTRNNSNVVQVRGQGLMNGIELRNKRYTDDLIKLLRMNGILTKSTHDTIIRLAPPLIITEDEVDTALEIICDCIDYLE